MFKNKKNYSQIFLYFFLLFGLIFLIIYKTPGLKGSIDQDLRILTENPIIVDKRFPIKQSLPNIKIAIQDLLSFKQKDFEILNIDMDFENLDELKKNRTDALKNGLLENPSKVNLELNWKGKKIRSSGRLKGDFNDHRNFNKQWSLKLNLKNSENIEGMTEFSITNHQSRSFPYNFIISKNLERMGLHVPKFKTVKVNFNGYDWGIMLMEEHFTTEFLENRKLKNNLIFKMSDEQLIRFTALYLNKGILDYDEYKILTKWQDKFNIYYHNEKRILEKELTFEKKDFLKKITLLKSINHELNLENKKTTDELVEKYIDLKSFSIMFVSSLAWGENDLHSMELHNARFYINPYTLKILPIPSDYDFIFRPYEKKYNLDEFISESAVDMLTLPPFYSSIFKNKKFQKFYIESLNEFEKNIENITNDTKKICSDYNQICNNAANLNELKENIAKLQLSKNKLFDTYMKKQNEEIIINNKIYQQYLKKNNFNQGKYFEMYKEHIYARFYENGDLNLYNLTTTDLYIDSVEIDDLNFKKSLDLNIKASTLTDIKNSKLNLNLNSKANSIVKINYSFKKNETKKSYQTFVEKKINLIKKDINFYDFTKNNISVTDNNITFENKKYIIDKPINIPEDYNLIILDGANLLFTENSYILLNKGSLKILGTKDNKVNISALKKKWGGIHVIGSGKNSEINYANFSKLDYFQNDKYSLTGGLNFYNSNVKIDNSIFTDSSSEDFINFVKSDFYVSNSTFSKTKSDAIDSDFSMGKIENSKFSDIGGDAIDTSGSIVEINKTKIFNVGDKAISAGEDSLINVLNIFIDSAKIGIASKDSSKVFGENISIKNSKSLDLTSYNKKKVYKGGLIEVKKVISDNKYLSQLNSVLTVNNKKIIEKKFNTKDLY
tara:strand:+ start:922 stop:3606 length:2685 start_codon:yes stop_codon:yes gene_type:complete